MGQAGASAPIARAHERCRVCGSRELVRYLDMGTTPLANSYLQADQLAIPEPAVELAVQLCRGCGLSQLTRVVDRDVMFRSYLYVSSTTRTFRDHCAELSRTAARAAAMRAGDLALDIASNDGLLLSCFASLGMRVVGIDPARDLAAEATARGIPTIPEYWDRSVASDVVARHGPASAITATNVLAHVDDVDAFAAAVALALAPGGIFVAEFPYVLDLIERNEFDTVYHEHLSYFGLTPAVHLLSRHGLAVFDIDRFPDIHGGTVRVMAARAGEREVSARVSAMLEAERAFGLTDPAPHLAFGGRTRRNMDDLVSLVHELRARGDVVWAYGASAKGNTLMNYAGLGADTVPVVIDDNEKKWGLYTPGAHMRIVGPSALAGGRPDHLLLLAWNFEREIVERSRAAGHRGGWIRPVPQAELLAAAAVA